MSRRVAAATLARVVMWQDDSRLNVAMLVVFLGLSAAPVAPYLAMDPQVGNWNWLWSVPGLGVAAAGLLLLRRTVRHLVVEARQSPLPPNPAGLLGLLDKAIQRETETQGVLALSLGAFVLLMIPFGVWLVTSVRHGVWWISAAALLAVWNGLLMEQKQQRLRRLQAHRMAVELLDSLRR